VKTLGKPSSVMVYDFKNEWFEEEKKKMYMKKLFLSHPMILLVHGFLISQNQMLAPWFLITETEFRSLPTILQGIMLHKSNIKLLITRLHNLLGNPSRVKKVRTCSEE